MKKIKRNGESNAGDSTAKQSKLISVIKNLSIKGCQKNNFKY